MGYMGPFRLFKEVFKFCLIEMMLWLIAMNAVCYEEQWVSSAAIALKCRFIRAEHCRYNCCHNFLTKTQKYKLVEIIKRSASEASWPVLFYFFIYMLDIFAICL